MNADALKVVVEDFAGLPGTLLVDNIDIERKAEFGDEVTESMSTYLASLSSAGVTVIGEPGELWRFSSNAERSFRVAVIGKPRCARDLYRILSLAERLVASGGSILIMPDTCEGVAAENRFEATEVFLGVHPGWERRLRGGRVVELRNDPLSEGGKYLSTDQIDRFTRPRGKRVISLALFGVGGYWDGVGAYVRAHHALFPGYELRIHHDDSIDRVPYGKVLRALASSGLVTLVHMAPDGLALGKCRAMLWRLAPAWDDTVEYVFARDLDSLPTWRERRAVEEFIASGFEAHQIGDNISHAGLMGGLCGFRADRLRAVAGESLEAFIASAGFSEKRWSKHGADQEHMNRSLAHRLMVYEHSVFHHVEEDGSTFKREAPTIPGAKLVYDIAPFDDPNVPVLVKEKSDALIAYMGVAGCDHAAALAFYDKHGGEIVEKIRAVEEAAVGRDC